MTRSRRRPRKLKPSGRNPYVAATRRLGHRIKKSLKEYRRKGRGAARKAKEEGDADDAS